MIEKSTVTDVRVRNFVLEFAQGMFDFFNTDAITGYEKEPEYDSFNNCFDQGLSEEKIKANYEFVDIAKFEDKASVSLIGIGKITVR